jgi:hypothetical protein
LSRIDTITIDRIEAGDYKGVMETEGDAGRAEKAGMTIFPLDIQARFAYLSGHRNKQRERKLENGLCGSYGPAAKVCLQGNGLLDSDWRR